MNTTNKHQDKVQQAEKESISEIKRQRTATKNTVIAMVLLFVALVIGSGATSTPNGSLSTRDVVWGILSVLAFAGLLWSLYVSHKQADERQQLIHLKATSLTFIVVLFSVVTAQILQALDIFSLTVSIQIIVIGGIVLWTSLLKAVERHSN